MGRLLVSLVSSGKEGSDPKLTVSQGATRQLDSCEQLNQEPAPPGLWATPHRY